MLDYDPDVAKWLFEQCGLDPQAGARPLRRLIKLWVEDAVADVLIENRTDEKLLIKVRMGDARPEASVVDRRGPTTGGLMRTTAVVFIALLVIGLALARQRPGR